METFIRSTLFHICFLTFSIICSFGFIWAFFIPRRYVPKVIHLYQSGVNFLEEKILDLRCEVRGWEHLPKKGSYIIAAKHQSIYETMQLCYLLKDPAMVLKREITLFVPIWGWYLAKMGMIPIDRSSGKTAMTKISKAAEKVLAEGRPIVVFPQGTRVTPGAKKPYKAGLTKLYKDLQIPVVPMALNSGVFWPKRSYLKHPGKIIFEFHPPIPPGRPPLQVAKDIENLIEKRSDELSQEALKTLKP